MGSFSRAYNPRLGPINRNPTQATTSSTSPPIVSCVPARERGVGRGTYVDKTMSGCTSFEAQSVRPRGDTYSNTRFHALPNTALSLFLSDPSPPSPPGRAVPSSRVPAAPPVSVAGQGPKKRREALMRRRWIADETRWLQDALLLPHPSRYWGLGRSMRECGTTSKICSVDGRPRSG